MDCGAYASAAPEKFDRYAVTSCSLPDVERANFLPFANSISSSWNGSASFPMMMLRSENLALEIEHCCSAISRDRLRLSKQCIAVCLFLSIRMYACGG